MTTSGEGGAPSSLDEAKRTVQKEFLGLAGIHGVGKKPARQSIRIYAQESSEELDRLLTKIKLRCSPFDVELVIEARPSIEVSVEQSDSPQSPVGREFES
jgi:hypothetical protein